MNYMNAGHESRRGQPGEVRGKGPERSGEDIMVRGDLEGINPRPIIGSSADRVRIL